MAQNFRRKNEDHHHHQHDGQHERELHVGDGSADRRGSVGDHGNLERGGQRGLQLRQHCLDRVDYVDGIGAGLALDVEQYRRLALEPGCLFRILDAVDRPADITQHHRCAIPIGDHRVLIGVCCKQLVVGIDVKRLPRPVERSLPGLSAVVAAMLRRTSSSDMPSMARRGPGRPATAPRGSRPLLHRHRTNARDLRQFRHNHGDRVIVDLVQRQRVRGERQDQHRRIGGIDQMIGRWPSATARLESSRPRR